MNNHLMHDVILAATMAKSAAAAASGGTPANARIISQDETVFALRNVVEVVGIPVYVDDVSQYSAYGLTQTGWYVFAGVTPPAGVEISASTSVTGAAGSVITPGAAAVLLAVRFGVAAMSQPVTVTWAPSVADSYLFRATDLAVRNLDYRTTFYIYDLAPFVTWSFALTTDGTFVADKNYYTESGGEYTLAEVTAGEAVPANTYYNHSKLHIEGMARNVTYQLDEVVDCPSEIVLPAIEDDGHGAWFEMRFRHSGSFSSTLLPEDEDVKIATEHTQAESAGMNMVDLHYMSVAGVKLWRFLNTHSTIPTASTEGGGT